MPPLVVTGLPAHAHETRDTAKPNYYCIGWGRVAHGSQIATGTGENYRRRNHWRSFSKYSEHDMGPYCIDVATADEMNVLGLVRYSFSILVLNTEPLRESYNSWGPSARNCVWFTRDPGLICSHEQAAFEVTDDFTRFQNPSTRSLSYGHHPTLGNWQP
ncbi:hypothetical protein V8E53_007090 [Lactarius tabidus]